MTQDLRNHLEYITTMPNMTAMQQVEITEPSIKSAKLPDTARYPQIYIPVDIHVDKPGGVILALIVFLFIVVCTAVNIGMLFMHHIIIVK